MAAVLTQPTLTAGSENSEFHFVKTWTLRATWEENFSWIAEFDVALWVDMKFSSMNRTVRIWKGAGPDLIWSLCCFSPAVWTEPNGLIQPSRLPFQPHLLTRPFSLFVSSCAQRVQSSPGRAESHPAVRFAAWFLTVELESEAGKKRGADRCDRNTVEHCG